jgi:hypothetical protein
MKAAFLRGRGQTRRRKAQLGCVLGTTPWHATLTETLCVIAARAGRVRCAGLLTIFVKRFTISKTGVELSSGLFIVRWASTGERPASLCGQYFLQTPLPVDSPGAPMEYEGSRRLALFKPRKPTGNQKALYRVEFVSWDFHSTKYFVSGFALCFDIIVMPEQVVVVLFTLFKLAFRRNFASN